MRNYWLVNYRNNMYVPITDADVNHFDGDWKQHTPFNQEDYINLSVQTVWPDQSSGPHLFYDYDLTRDGMLVGVYFDASQVTKEVVDQFIHELLRAQDVLSLRRYKLVRSK